MKNEIIYGAIDVARRTMLAMLVLCAGAAFGQTAIEKSISAPLATTYSVDRRGDFYLGFNTGTLAKYDANGQELLNYSPQRLGTISLIDAWNPLRIFLFYRDFQTIVILDRFLTPTASYELGKESSGQFSGFIKLACPSQDQSFWLIDESYNSLLKYVPESEQIVLKIPLNNAAPEDAQVLYMREYQNLLFVSLSSGGILYFDNLGNYRGKVDTEVAVDFFGFSGNQIYFRQGISLRYINLYDDDTRLVNLPLQYDAVLDIGRVNIGLKKEGGFDLLR